MKEELDIIEQNNLPYNRIFGKVVLFLLILYILFFFISIFILKIDFSQYIPLSFTPPSFELFEKVATDPLRTKSILTYFIVGYLLFFPLTFIFYLINRDFYREKFSSSKAFLQGVVVYVFSHTLGIIYLMMAMNTVGYSTRIYFSGGVISIFVMFLALFLCPLFFAALLFAIIEYVILSIFKLVS
ncbi:hypothetical protein [Phocoenobacter skyensis]|uniref:Uncharacterized protein n=1 Tax=Phocoenobacter skyensis TaxID=97481 RepID=A0A1H7UZW8_9PAST|nr:hypothetical protein [Pasteurella skyensis]MDP8078524.1 hypothetical protein [Pasteurella skyensis]MDP8084384.1 hypothetical protein [Pasteurella skyensis]MDP8184715.1 hypothetical protein [Pasteurella skyensis]QLB23189.1 hypothetical protein A6B44_08210 [Pasteurella skyensis]SEM02037.1 hypothetical protein SAMN05444853_10371 [Pasteurella skyensis]